MSACKVARNAELLHVHYKVEACPLDLLHKPACPSDCAESGGTLSIHAGRVIACIVMLAAPSNEAHTDLKLSMRLPTSDDRLEDTLNATNAAAEAEATEEDEALLARTDLDVDTGSNTDGDATYRREIWGFIGQLWSRVKHVIDISIS